MTNRKAPADGGFCDCAVNGIFLRVPRAFHPARVERRLLSLASPDGGSLVVTWHPGPVRREGLALARRAAPKAALAAWDLPRSWRRAAGARRAQGFREKGEGAGRGAVLFCEQCKGAVLLYFSPAPGGAFPTKTICNILAGITDHPPGPGTPLRLFDLSARIPEGFALQSALFDSGLFFLTFARKKQILRLCRLAPASAVLARTDMASLARGLFPEFADGKGDVDVYEQDGAPACRGVLEGRKLPFLPRARTLCRLWQPLDRNRILGVMLRGRDLEEEFDAVCQSYEISQAG